MTPQTIADITPNGSATAIGAAGIKATWIIFVASGTTIRVGDSNVGAARGSNIPTGVPVLWPRCDFNQGRYDLGSVYVYGGSGSDKVSITYGA
jgi:hypothetical protein